MFISGIENLFTWLLVQFPTVMGGTAALGARITNALFETCKVATDDLKCGHIKEGVANLSWLQICNIFILAAILVRVPFYVRYACNTRLDFGRSYRNMRTAWHSSWDCS